MPDPKPATQRRTTKAATADKAAERDAQKAWTAQDVWERLAAPFAADELEKLPRNLQARDDNRGRCEDTAAGHYYSADGHYCGGWHARSLHLDYVGHAGITMRLNDVLGPGGWDFAPYAHDSDAMPIIGREFYARLTVRVPDCEPVTKWDLAANYQSLQEAYGDALRRCAMRFGVGTYLWSKSEAALALKAATDDAQPPAPPERPVERQDAPQGRQEPKPFTDLQAKVNDRVMSLAPDASQRLITWVRQHDLPNIEDLSDRQAQAVLDYLASQEGDPDPT